MKKYGYHAETLEEKLTKEERKRLESIRSDLRKAGKLLKTLGRLISEGSRNDILAFFRVTKWDCFMISFMNMIEVNPWHSND